MGFPCTSCGLCCHQAAKLKKVDPGFPYEARPDGSCEKLIGRLCSVYDHRPDICNIDKTVERFGLDKRRFYEKNAEACNALIAQAGESEKYQVRIKDE